MDLKSKCICSNKQIYRNWKSSTSIGVFFPYFNENIEVDDFWFKQICLLQILKIYVWGQGPEPMLTTGTNNQMLLTKVQENH